MLIGRFKSLGYQYVRLMLKNQLILLWTLSGTLKVNKLLAQSNRIEDLKAYISSPAKFVYKSFIIDY